MRDGHTETTVDWGTTNQPLSPAHWDGLLTRMMQKAREADLFVFDGFACHAPSFQLSIRVVTRKARHSLFAHQLFVRPTAAPREDFQPQ